jgi:hypothetical protein
VKFTPVDRPLFPGWPKLETAWTEIRYAAYCYVLPKWANDARMTVPPGGLDR